MRPLEIATRTKLPVFSPNRFERATSVSIKDRNLWCVVEDTTYQYDTMSFPVPIKAGLIRGVPFGVQSVTFGSEVIVEIQE